METIKKIELKKSFGKGNQFLYEAIEDGKIIAKRMSSREYVAAICSINSKKIINGIGRADLIPNAVSKIVITGDMRLAVLSENQAQLSKPWTVSKN